MSFSDKSGRKGEEIAEEIKENDFPVLRKLITELSSNLDKHSQFLKKDRETIEEFLRENQRLFDNISLALKSELKRKNPSKTSQLPKLEKTVGDLERRLRLANLTLNSIGAKHEEEKTVREKPKNARIEGKNAGSQPQDEENQRLIVEEEKQALIDFEVHEENLHEREQRIQAVNRNLKEVNKLYSEIAEMGRQQSEHVEIIGENVEKTAAKVYSSKRELLKAKEIFDQSRDRYCKSLCCLLVVFILVIVIFFYSNK